MLYCELIILNTYHLFEIIQILIKYIIITNFIYIYTHYTLTSLPGSPGIPLGPTGPAGPGAPTSPVSPRGPLQNINYVLNKYFNRYYLY